MKLFLSKTEKEYYQNYISKNPAVPKYFFDDEFINSVPSFYLENLIKLFAENNMSEKEFKFAVKILKTNKKLFDQLIALYRSYPEVFTKEFINKYGEKFLLNYGEILPQLIQNNLESFIPLLNDFEYDERLKSILLDPNSNILKMIDDGLDPKAIFLELDLYPQIQQIYLFLNDEERKLFLSNVNSLEKEELKLYIDNIISCYNSISKLPNAIKDVMGFYLNNPKSVFPKEEITKYLENRNNVPENMFNYESDIPAGFKDDIILYNMSKETNIDTLKKLALSYSLHIELTSTAEEQNLVNIMQMMIDKQYPCSENVTKYLDLFNKINSSTSKEEIMNLLNNDLSKYKDEVKESAKSFISYDIGEGLLDPKKLEGNSNVTITSEKLASGKAITYITLHDVPFVSLTHSIIDCSQDPLKRATHTDQQKELAEKLPSHPELWGKSEDGTKHISMSLNSSFYFKSFGVPLVMLGFSKTREDQIIQATDKDSGTSMSVGEKGPVKFDYPGKDKLLETARHNYNEVLSEREGTIPDYLMVIDDQSSEIPVIDENIKKWAEYYGIPIVVIDSKSYIQGALNRYQAALEYLKSKDDITLEEIETLDNMRKSIDTFARTPQISEVQMIKDLINSKSINDQSIDSIIEFINKNNLSQIPEVIELLNKRNKTVAEIEDYNGRSK